VKGAGVLRWDPASGFAIDVFVKQRVTHVPIAKVDIPSLAIPVVSTARVDLGPDAWVLTPARDLNQDADFIGGSVVRLRSGVALFRRRYRENLGGARRHGDATLRVLPGTILPDLVAEEVTIAGKRVRQGARRAGLDLELEDGSFQAEFLEPDVVRAWWSLDTGLWAKGSDWRLGESVGYALGLLLGQRIRLLRRRAVRGRTEYEEVRRVTEVAENLGFQALFDRPPHFDKEHFVALLRMFGRNGREASIARCVFDQLADAAQQSTWQARELLTATVLEAVMRNVFRKPFVPGERWDFSEPLKGYCRERLGGAWVPTADRAHDTWRRLRHRNAHPDWSLERGGPAGREQVDGAVDDLIFLSRFYGYLILSLSGIRDLEPRFPRPHKDWSPLVTMVFRGSP
jgi:hypothetical protein